MGKRFWHTVVKALRLLFKRKFLISHFLNVSLKKAVSELLLGSLVHWHLLRTNETTSLQTAESPPSCQTLNFLPLHSKRYLRSTCFPLLKGSHHSSKGLSNDYTAITTVSKGQMSPRIKRCCSMTYFSNLAAW